MSFNAMPIANPALATFGTIKPKAGQGRPRLSTGFIEKAENAYKRCFAQRAVANVIRESHKAGAGPAGGGDGKIPRA